MKARPPMKAVYNSQPFYGKNPFIDALPLPMDNRAVVKQLQQFPEYTPDDRLREACQRMELTQNVFHFLQPLPVHVDAYRLFSMAIRQSYIPRNPNVDISQLCNNGIPESYEAYRCLADSAPPQSFSITGISGAGKTTGVSAILNLFPSIIEHTFYDGKKFEATQLVWLKTDCTFASSLKGFCELIVRDIDKTLGSKYLTSFMNKLTNDNALSRVVNIFDELSLGVFVVDEIQHLCDAPKASVAKLLNFLVTLSNTSGAALVLIGTLKATNLLRANFRVARRTNTFSWNRMGNDSTFEFFLEVLWELQYTKNYAPLTKELTNILYEYSQGIVDVLLKLFTITQMNAIKDGVELITTAGIKKTYAYDLASLVSMIEVIKAGDEFKMAKFEDILDIEPYMRSINIQMPPVSKDPAIQNSDMKQQVVLRQSEINAPATTAAQLFKEAVHKYGAAQPLSVILKCISQNSEMAPEKSWRMLQLVCSGFCEQTPEFFRCFGYNFGICSKY
jgi:hypothetical protein